MLQNAAVPHKLMVARLRFRKSDIVWHTTDANQKVFFMFFLFFIFFFLRPQNLMAVFDWAWWTYTFFIVRFCPNFPKYWIGLNVDFSWGEILPGKASHPAESKLCIWGSHSGFSQTTTSDHRRCEGGTEGQYYQSDTQVAAAAAGRTSLPTANSVLNAA